jgi:large subunit ribosomal protein L18
MALFKSVTSLQVQLIDDENGVTLVSARTGGRKNTAAAEELGRRIAELADARGVKQVVVDRGGFRFHGRIKAVVDAAVASGLSIGDVAAPARPEQVEAAPKEDAGEEDK